LHVINVKIIDNATKQKKKQIIKRKVLDLKELQQTNLFRFMMEQRSMHYLFEKPIFFAWVLIDPSDLY
jgi:hypothetical protein